MSAKFSIVKRGYEPLEVDSYIETLENVIKSYKEKDNAIKNAIISAQLAADGIVNEAKEHSNKIFDDSLNYVSDIRNSISEQRALLDGFKAEYSNLMNKYLARVSDADFDEIGRKITILENYFDKLVKEKDGIPRKTPEGGRD